MIASALILAAATTAVWAYALAIKPAAVSEARNFTLRESIRLAIRLPFALVAASLLAELIPDDWVADLIGSESGFAGILIAAFAGGLLPGGPMVSFPIALVLAGEGAGTAQLVALISGWSVFALHRVISYESPLLGWRFVALRLICSLPVPIVAGLLMAAVVSATGEISVGTGFKLIP